MSDKRNKFIGLAENRVDKTIKYIDLIGNLSNRNNYEYSQEDIDKIFKHVERALAASKSRFSEQLKSNKNASFKL